MRTLTALLAREFGPSGIHVATVRVGGAVAPGGPFDTDRIAEHYWRLHMNSALAKTESGPVAGGIASALRAVGVC